MQEDVQDDANSEDEVDGEDLFEQMEADYKPVDGLDRYEADGLDDDG